MSRRQHRCWQVLAVPVPAKQSQDHPPPGVPSRSFRLPRPSFGGWTNTLDAFYAKCSTFPLKWFQDDATPEPKLVGMSILFLKLTTSYTWAMELFIGMQLGFC